MAEVITSPIARSINAINRRFSASAFGPSMNAIKGDRNSPVDPELTRIIIRNTNAVNTVTTQLTNVASQVSVLTQSLNAISQSLALSSQLEDQRMNAEANRQRQLATIGLREGKEGSIEKKIASAALTPVEFLAKKATNILSALGSYFSTILFGWLSTQTLDLLSALASGNEEKIREIRNTIIKGIAIAAGAFIGVNVVITALALSLKGLVKKIVSITFNGLIKKPFISLVNLFRKGAGASLIQGGIRNNVPPVNMGQTKNLLPGKVGPLGRIGNFFKSSWAPGLLDAGLDVASGKDPVGAAIDTTGGLGGASLMSKLPIKNKPLRFGAKLLGFFGGKNLTESQRLNAIGGEKFNGNQQQNQGGLTDSQKNYYKQELMKGRSYEDIDAELSLKSPKKDTKPQGLMRGLAGTADFLSFGLTDFDKRGDLVKGSTNKKDLNKQANLALAEPAPEIINMNGGQDQTAQAPTGSSGTGGMGGNVPKIPANNNDNSYVYSGFREYQIAPV